MDFKERLIKVFNNYGNKVSLLRFYKEMRFCEQMYIHLKIWKVSISKSELVGYGFWTVTDEVGPRITSILSLVVWLLTIVIGSEEAPIRCPAVGALELIADIATPVTVLSNYAQIVLARSDHFCTLVCFLCHLLYLLFFT